MGDKGDIPLKIEKKPQSKSKRPQTPVVIPSSEKVSTVKKSDTTQGCDKKKRPHDSSGNKSPDVKKSMLGKRPQDSQKGGSQSPTKTNVMKTKVSKISEQPSSATKVKKDSQSKQSASRDDFKSPTLKKSKSQKQKPGQGKFSYVLFNLIFLVNIMFDTN